jgi:hypothetical protein
VTVLDLASGRFLAPAGEWRDDPSSALLMSRDEADEWLRRFGCGGHAAHVLEEAAA